MYCGSWIVYLIIKETVALVITLTEISEQWQFAYPILLFSGLHPGARLAASKKA